jgi:hypothetical protein
VPYVLALVEAVLFTLAGAAATLATTSYSPLKPFFAFAWRMWLWGSIGFILANAVLLAILFHFLSGAGIAGGAPRHTDVLGFVLLALVLFGPVLFSTLGIVLGSFYGWLLARRSLARPGV